MRSSCAYPTTVETTALVADDEHPAVVLGVDLPVGPDRQGGVGRPDGELGQDLVHQDAVAVDLVEVAVLAVREYGADAVHGGRVDAPLEPEGMVRDARDRPVAVARTAVRVGVLPAPVDLQVRRQRGHEVLLRVHRIGGRTSGGTDGA